MPHVGLAFCGIMVATVLGDAIDPSALYPWNNPDGLLVSMGVYATLQLSTWLSVRVAGGGAIMVLPMMPKVCSGFLSGKQLPMFILFCVVFVLLARVARVVVASMNFNETVP